MSVHVVSSKTNQYCQGDSIIVAHTGTKTCPVAMMERYFAMATVVQSSALPLFCGITSTKGVSSSVRLGA